MTNSYKHILLTCTLFFIFTNLSYSQHKKERFKEIEAYKVAYFTKEIDFTVEEAEKFWPLYRSYDKKKHDLKRTEYRKILNDIKSKGGIDTLSEEESQHYLNEMIRIDLEIDQNQIAFYKNVQKILSAKKVMKLKIAELTFNKKLLKRLHHKKKEKH